MFLNDNRDNKNNECEKERMSVIFILPVVFVVSVVVKKLVSVVKNKDITLIPRTSGFIFPRSLSLHLFPVLQCLRAHRCGRYM